jgi:hypothetical protein
MSVITVGAEIRYQERRDMEGCLILLHFLDAELRLLSAHVGRMFSAEEDPLPHMEQAIQNFPMDGLDLQTVQRNSTRYVYSADVEVPRQSDRGHRLREAHLWVPTAEQVSSGTRLEGDVIGSGATVELGAGGWYLVPWLTLRVRLPEGIRNIHARLDPPFAEKNRIKTLTHLLRKGDEPGELPSLASQMMEELLGVPLLLGAGMIQAETGGYFRLLAEEELSAEFVQRTSPEVSHLRPDSYHAAEMCG